MLRITLCRIVLFSIAAARKTVLTDSLCNFYYGMEKIFFIIGAKSLGALIKTIFIMPQPFIFLGNNML